MLWWIVPFTIWSIWLITIVDKSPNSFIPSIAGLSPDPSKMVGLSRTVWWSNKIAAFFLQSDLVYGHQRKPCKEFLFYLSTYLPIYLPIRLKNNIFKPLASSLQDKLPGQAQLICLLSSCCEPIHYQQQYKLPSDKHTKKLWKSLFLMGKFG